MATEPCLATGLDFLGDKWIKCGLFLWPVRWRKSHYLSKWRELYPQSAPAEHTDRCLQSLAEVGRSPQSRSLPDNVPSRPCPSLVPVGRSPVHTSQCAHSYASFPGAYFKCLFKCSNSVTPKGKNKKEKWIRCRLFLLREYITFSLKSSYNSF